MPMKAGGGILGLVVVLASLFLPRLLGGGSQGFTGADDPSLRGADVGPAACQTEVEQILCGAVDDVSEYWIAEYPRLWNEPYREADTVFFSGGTDTACGQASSQLGPFYCPADELVYFDLDFLVQMQQQFGATGDLAAQYIVAHEYGHHVQNVLGVSTDVRRLQQQDPGMANQYSVALELQADCFAGAWASSADERGLLEQGEIREALDAAAAVGDDRIQSRAGMSVDQESFTHGTSEQRVQWFRRGYDTGDARQCSTFDEL
jgi:predicted metalloprotease